jgi:hypothetical protein
VSVIGSPIETSLLQAAQAQQVASKARDSEKASRDSAARRFQDMVDLRVAGVESADAPRRVPPNDSQQAHDERKHREFQHFQPPEPEGQQRIDVKA